MRSPEASAARDPDLDALARLGEAFGEPTRVRIYGLLSTAAAPCSAGELAQALGLHRTVIRAHLERLVELGFGASGVRHTGRGGRPAKIYAVAPDTVLPGRRHRWLAEAALDVVGELSVKGDVDSSYVAATLESAGESYGAGLRESLLLSVTAEPEPGPHGATSVATVRQTALKWLAGAGYEPQPGPGGLTDVTLKACAFADLGGARKTLVCAFDQGLLRGLFGVSAEELCVHVYEDEAVCRLEPVVEGSSESAGAGAVPAGSGSGAPVGAAAGSR